MNQRQPRMHAIFPGEKLKILPAGWFLAAYTLVALLLSLLPLLGKQWFFILALAAGPLVYAVFRYPRWVYRVMIALTLVLDSASAWIAAQDRTGTLLLILLAALPAALLAEMSYQLVREREHFERALRDSEERYRSFVTRLQGIAFNEPVRRSGFTFIHGPVEEITGYAPEDFLTGRISRDTLFLPEERVQLLREFEPLYTQPNFTIDREFRILTRDGRTRWLHEISQNVPGPDGQPLYVQGTVFDVTHQKEIEEAQIESEARFRALFLSMEEAFALYEVVPDENGEPRDFRFLAVNPVFERMFNMDGAQAAGHRLQEIIPEVNPQWLDLMAGVARTGQSKSVEGYSARVGGDLEVNIFQPQPGQVATISSNISARKAVERALRESQAHFRSLFENSPVSLWDEDFSTVKAMVEELVASGVKDLRAYFHQNPAELLRYSKALVVNDVNRACLTLMGARTKEDLLSRVGQLIGRTLSDAMVEEICAIAEGRTYFQWEGINDVVDGQPHYHRVTWSVAPGSEETYQRVIVAIDDITDSKRTEEALLYLSSHDTLTGLYNRAFFDAEMGRLKHGRLYPITIFFADMDGLKATNDHLGHAVGDEMLKRAARVLRDSFRSEDVVARIGGDEFGVLLAGVDTAGAQLALQRVRQVLAQHNAASPDLPPMRFSIGHATARAGDDLNQVLHQADERMYQEKPQRRA